ncbi:hypothetical protein NCAS_0C04660 [Naumovozyma castellii]|uniref:Transcription activator GCR1-like domain-containing protein n=1 Tax=Naumovozyma castellii TaxID=27288 RepID=G0VD94_NAUCA|nr:hypothetical protein NCAS_0C04660 [Naumovozyma castellii CBS 4309]CCC69456.1 hypothetical protein NCAS_0C04660 [Naumovozyma castellii CBS 4309]
MNKEDAILISRVADLERRMAVFEGMFHALSSRLDNHFKKYDLVMTSQQQQISELNGILLTLLNDQSRHADVLKEKLSTSLHGIAALGVNSAPSAAGNQTIFPSRQFDPNENVNADVLFEDILNNNQVDKTNADNHAQQQTEKNPQQQHQQVRAQSFQGPSLSYGNFNQLSRNAANQPPPNLLNETDDSASSLSLPEPTFRNTAASSIQLPSYSDADKDDYYTRRGNKVKKNLYNRIFHFTNSPQTVMGVWQEYTQGLNGQPSIKEMEALYHAEWRRDPAVNRRYSRRKVIWKAIETGLSKGYTLEDVINRLENHRVIDSERDLKQPMGWLCQSSNIPEEFKPDNGGNT